MPLITATIETINGVNTASKVAILTLAAKATGNIPNPALDGASKLVPNEIMYKATHKMDAHNPTIAKGRRNKDINE